MITLKVSQIEGMVYGLVLRPDNLTMFGDEPCTNCGELNVVRCIVLDTNGCIMGRVSLCLECTQFAVYDQYLLEHIAVWHGFIELAKIYMGGIALLYKLVGMGEIRVELD